MFKRCLIRSVPVALVLSVGFWTSASHADTIIGGVINWTATDPLYIASTLYPTEAQYLSAAATAGYASDPGAWVAPAGQTYTGTLNLTNNAVIIQADNSTDAVAAYQNVLNMVESGYNGGEWTGTGITSSYAAADVAAHYPVTGIGLEINDGPSGHIPFDVQYATYDGVTLNTNSLIMTYTYQGDVNLQGSVSSDDINSTLSGYDDSRSGWANGDVAYGPSTTSDDINAVLTAFGRQGTDPDRPEVPTYTYPTEGGAQPAFAPVGVPEPSTGIMWLLGVVAAAGASFVRRRKIVGKKETLLQGCC
ncbi:MAG TPA: PEP-CTERM sorting domain-containing protein [Pirellulales bacterium]|jgi:hypothetical protein|nr:PEP-CTERM sorting domain-containing protein [Pirellulales bacterium]